MKTWRSIVSLLLILVFALELLPLSSFAIESSNLTATEAVGATQPMEESASNAVSADDPYVVSEVEDLREESVKHFRMSDGSFLAVQYGTPVHYKDENDQWQEIDNTLIEKDGKLLTKYGDIEKTFYQTLSDGKLFDVNVGDYSLGMSLMSPGGKSGDDVITTGENDQYEFDTAVQNAEQAEAETADPVDKESAEAPEPVEGSTDAETEAKATPALADPSAAKLPEDESVIRVISAPSIKATVESKAPMRIDASEHLTADMLVARESSTAEVCYKNVFQSVDLKYQSSTNSIKESIIIKAPQPSYSYSFLLTLSGVTPQLQDDGSVICSDKDGESIFVIPAPYMIDAAGAVSLDAQYALMETDSKWIITVTANTDWMNAPDRTFPVTLDPTVNYPTDSFYDRLPVTYVAEGAPTTAHNKPSGLYVGYDGSLKQMEVYMAVPTLLSLPENSEFTGAAIVFIQSSYSFSEQSSINITVHQVTDTSSSAGTANWIYNMTWNNKPTYDNDILDHCKVSSGVMVVSLDVTRAVRSWYDDSTITHALALAAYSLPNSGTAASTLCGYSIPVPTLYVSYRNIVGLENYYTYQAFDVGNAGSAFIADHSGQLTVLTPLASFSSTANPFSLELVYNSALDSSTIRPTHTLKTMLGKGMSLNIIQKLEPRAQNMVYTDGDGTQHTFAHDSSMGGTDMYYDEDGLGLKIQVQDDCTSILSDEDGNQWTFINGYLAIMQDGNGNQYEIHYIRGDGATTNWQPSGANDLLDCVVQKNAGGSEITVATFAHNNDGYLTSITDYAGRVITLSYTSGLIYTDLTSVSRNGTELASFGYTGRMTKVQDSATGCGLALTYDGKCVTSLCFFGAGNGNNRETTIIEHEGSRTTYTTGNVSTTYLFDAPGRTVNAYTTQNDYLVGAANAVYTGIGDTSRMMNRTMQTGAIGVTAHSWMRNGNFENTSAFAWTLTGAGGTNTNIVISGDKTHTGNFALKGWLAASANGTTTASHQTYSLRSDLKYAASAYVNTYDVSEFGSNGCVKLEVLNSSGVVIASDSIDYKTSRDIDSGWTRLSTSFQASGIVTVRISAVNARGIFYADDVQIEPAAPGTEIAAPSNVNLIENGNLQYYNSGWTRTDHVSWSNDFGRLAETNGAYSLCVQGSPVTSENAFQIIPINLSGAETYVLSGWAKAQSIYTGEGALYGVLTDPASDDGKRFGLCAEITYSNNDNDKEYHYAPFNPDLTEWQFTSIAIVPKNAKNPDGSYKTVASIKVSCIYNNNVGPAYFDDFSLVREVAQTMTYDSDGNLESVNSTGATADQNSFTNGKLIQTITGENRTLTYSYENTNNSHLITKISDGAVQDSFTYDIRGNITQEDYSPVSGQDPIRNKFEYTDDGNRLKSTTTFGCFSDASVPNSVLTSYTYANSYNKMMAAPSMVSQYHTTISNVYDQNYDHLTQTTQSNAGTLSYTYNSGFLDTLTRTNYTGGDSQTYSFSYNAFGDRTLSSVGNTPLEQSTYDSASGNLLNTTYGNGATISYTYDALYRMTSKTTTTSGSSRTVNYVYNGNGDLYEQIEPNGETLRYRYDSLNRPAGLRRTGFNNTLNTSYQYDKCGRLETYSYQIANLFSGSETYNYKTTTDSTGAAGAIAQIEMASGDTVDYTYDALHRLNHRIIGGTLDESYSYASSYDNSGTNTTALSTTMIDGKTICDPNSSGSILYSWNYYYDRAGNIVTATDSYSSQLTTYTYDNQDQLTKVVTPDITYIYSYDQAGNLQTAKIGNTTHTYTYGNNQWKDLLTAYDGHTITYDAIGNPLSYYNGSNNTLTWTEGRRLNTARKNNTTTTYSYDADGFRTRKVFSSGGRVDYYWDNGRLVGEARYTLFGIATNYIQYHYDETGSPIGFTNNGTDFYYAKNLQGDVVAIYQKLNNNGTITTSCVARYDYDPWGKCTVKTADGRVDILLVSVGHINPFRFKGYYYDTETGFYYLQSRYYDPAIGRYINADVITCTGQGFTGCNMFAYCGNNPVTRFDPAGDFWVEATLFVGGAFISGYASYSSGGTPAEVLASALCGGFGVIAPEGMAIYFSVAEGVIATESAIRQNKDPIYIASTILSSSLPLLSKIPGIEHISPLPSETYATRMRIGRYIKHALKTVRNNLFLEIVDYCCSRSKRQPSLNPEPWLKIHVVPIRIPRIHLNISITYKSTPYTYRPTYYNFDFSGIDSAILHLSSL